MENVIAGSMLVFLVVGIFLGFLAGKDYDTMEVKEKSMFDKGYKMGYRKGKEEAEKNLVEKLKKL